MDGRTDALVRAGYSGDDIGLVAADDNKDNKEHMQTLYTALSISYEYLITSIKRKITWSLSLQKLAVKSMTLSTSSLIWHLPPTCTPVSRMSSKHIVRSLKGSILNL